MAINYRDPRYQEAVLAAHGRPGTNIPGAMQAITSAFAEQQQGVQNRFSRLFTNRRRFNANLRLANKKLSFRKKMHEQALKDARDASNLGIISGLGTSLIAGLIGRQRRKKTEAAATEQRAFNEGILKSQQAHNKRMEGILSAITGSTY